MTPEPKEVIELINNIDAKIEYYQGLREYATKEVERLLDAKKEMEKNVAM